ncbi:hypothetical protein WJX77_009023 [Trebouxia sp. C0004]
MEVQAQILASPELLDNHPELHWDKLAASATPQLGAAKSLLAARLNTGTLAMLEQAAVRSTMRQLAQVIAFTHQNDVIYRDIKPENVLLQDNGNIASAKTSSVVLI